MTKFVGIISAKGGVGKTTTTINLGSALHFLNRDVTIVDANFANPDLGIHLGFTNVDKTLHSALKGQHSIREGVYRHPLGIKIVPGSLSYNEAREAKQDNLVSTIYDLVGTTEAVLIDSTPGMGRDSQAVISAADYLIIITTPDIVSVSDSLKIIKLGRDMEKHILGVVVNKARGEDYEMSIENISEFLNMPVIAVIPEDPLIRKSLIHRSPVVLKDSNAHSSIGFKKLAGALIGEKYIENIEEEKELSLFSQILKNMGF